MNLDYKLNQQKEKFKRNYNKISQSVDSINIFFMQIHMKSELDAKNHSGVATKEVSHNVSLFSAQRKSAVHDLSQILIEDCQKVLSFY